VVEGASYTQRVRGSNHLKKFFVLGLDSSLLFSTYIASREVHNRRAAANFRHGLVNSIKSNKNQILLAFWKFRLFAL
jgi:hypothetical protein